MQKKNLQIETLRGISILLIVMGHVIGSTPEGGMQIDYPSPWRYLYLCSIYIRLPLITAIAGWVYALKPVECGGLSRFAKSKVNRLLIPMVIVGMLYFCIQYITPGTNRTDSLSSIWRLFFFPYTYFWYLYSLFVIQIAISLLDAKKWLTSFSGWAFWLLVCLLLNIAEQTIIPYSIPNLFSFKGALALSPYFMAGLGINRFAAELKNIQWQKMYIVLAVIGLILLQLQWFDNYGATPSAYSIIQPVFVLPLLALMFYHIPYIPLFAWVGGYSYSIYLYHGFGTSGGRIILSYLGITQSLIVFVFAFAVAVLSPIVVEKVLSKNKVTAFLFLGKKYKTSPTS